MSQVTTHVLDTSKGKPAQGITITLFKQTGADWQQLAKGVTNADGRIGDLLEPGIILDAGTYKMKFETQAWFDSQAIETFYPMVEIVFQMNAHGEHYHVPLLLNPFGYSTYRGS